jgi:uncharacterized protein (DUF1800 family)
MTVYFGDVGDVPLVGDLDGDGKDDIVVFRNGVWYVSTAAACAPGVTVCGAPQTNVYFFGAPGDVPMLADVNGDGQLDLLLYRNGVWYASTTRTGVASNVYFFGGVPGDVPIAFDYDGDGVADLGIFRNGAWYISTHRDGIANALFFYGQGGDSPLYFGPGAVSNGVIDAARLLQQATFGPTLADISSVQSMGITAWIDDQLAKPMTSYSILPGYTGAPPTAPGWWPQTRPATCTNVSGTPTQCQRDNYSIYQTQREFYRNALTAPDQLRQRVAFALSQILVTSAQQDTINYANRDYQQLLRQYAFGRFEDLLFAISVSPFMGNYLDMANNRKATATTSPNENYAREIMQLFSIGLFELNPDGSLILDAQSQPIPTYDQTEITELAKVMTGWTYWPRPGVSTFSWNAPVNYTNTMVPCEGPANPALPCGGTTDYHDQQTKTYLGYSQPAGGLADNELRFAVSVLAQHPNVGPFIGKQLIQHLVTSNPSPAYVARVSAVWNDDGTPQHVRGNLAKVVRAILLDPEARAPRNPVSSRFGKLQEPVLFVTGFLRALQAQSDAVYLINSRVTNMGQDPFNSPTVFNFYPADYVIPGTPLAGPQFGIFDATTYFARVNFLYNTLFSGCVPAPSTGAPTGGCAPDNTVAGATGTKIDLSILASKYNDVPGLVDYAANMLLFEPLPAAWRTAIINAVNAVTLSATPTNAQMYDRARTAVYLIALSPKYQVEH